MMNVCTNLTQAQAGQHVKVINGSGKVAQVAVVNKVWKNGVIELVGDRTTYAPNREGSSAYVRGRSTAYSARTTTLAPFVNGETVDGVQAQISAERAAAEAARERAEAEREAKVQAAIAQAGISYGDSADLPGVKIARWTDSRGQSRTTFYTVKVEKWLSDPHYYVSISDYCDGSFSSSSKSSSVSAEDAVARWIASWW